MKKPAGETKHILKVKVYEEWIRRPCGMPRFLVEQRIAEQYHISVSSVRRYIRNIDKYGYTPPVRPRQGRRVFAWDPAALDFMKAFYLAARRDAGYCTMRNAYLRTVAAAQEKGWKVGSEQSAYTHLRDIHSLLLTYASAAVLGRTGTAVCSAAGFPHGAASQAAKSAELRECIRRGAAEMDVAVNILALKSGEADACRRELQEMLQIARGKCRIKAIYEQSLYNDEEKKIVLSLIRECACEFVKISNALTGKKAEEADVRFVRDIVGGKVGIKIDGGVKTLERTLELLGAGADRIGMSATIAVAGEALEPALAG